MTASALLKKHGVNPNKNARAKKAVEDRVAEINKEKKAGTELSRKDLMLQAKAKGIKYFRILSKVELEKVIDPKTIQQDIDGVISDAKKRWKNGWGSRKEATTI